MKKGFYSLVTLFLVLFLAACSTGPSGASNTTGSGIKFDHAYPASHGDVKASSRPTSEDAAVINRRLGH